MTATKFLLQHGFNFDVLYRYGVPYLSRKEESDIRISWVTRDAEKAALAEMTIKQEDMPLIDHVRKSIQEWQTVPVDKQEGYLNIPNKTQDNLGSKSIPEFLNRYQIRLVHQIIRNEFPKLATNGKGHFIQITNLNEENKTSEKVLRDRHRENDVRKAIEFRWLVDALIGADITKMPDDYFLSGIPSDVRTDDDKTPFLNFVNDLQSKLKERRRILVGHNCFTDLVNFYKCFIGDLPDQVEDFQEAVHSIFPAVVDTKYLASFQRSWDTNLESVEKDLRTENTPVVEIPIDFDRYSAGQSYHEAGYDSLLTAKIAIKLSAKLERDGKYRGRPQNGGNANSVAATKHIEEDDEEQYVTAPESNQDNESIVSNMTSTITKVLSSPVSTITSLFRGDTVRHQQSAEGSTHGEQQDEQQQSKQEEDQHKNGIERASGFGGGIKSASTVVAVRERPLDWSDPREVRKLKNALASNNIYDLLADEHGDAEAPERQEKTGRDEEREVEHADQDQLSDLLIWSDKEDNGTGASPKAKNDGSETKAKCSRRMPAWDGGFWELFGNKLQVNGCEEGVCDLS